MNVKRSSKRLLTSLRRMIYVPDTVDKNYVDYIRNLFFSYKRVCDQLNISPIDLNAIFIRLYMTESLENEKAEYIIERELDDLILPSKWGRRARSRKEWS